MAKALFMALNKQRVIDTINAMPEEEFVNIDVLLERIVMLEKIEKAEKNIVEGKTYTTEEAKQQIRNTFYTNQ